MVPACSFLVLEEKLYKDEETLELSRKRENALLALSKLQMFRYVIHFIRAKIFILFVITIIIPPYVIGTVD